MQKEIQNRNFYNKGNSVPTILLKLFKSVWLKNKRDDQKKSSASASVIQLIVLIKLQLHISNFFHQSTTG